MYTWFQLICEQLSIVWLALSTDPVPFGLTGPPPTDWQADRLEEDRPTQWQLAAHTPTGLEALYAFKFFPDTRAVECWGSVTNRGKEAIPNIRECLTLNCSLQLPQAFGQPWLRTINGVRFVPNYFPPHDFAVVDRQMLDSPQVFTPLTIRGLLDGRPSGEHIPCAIICDEREQHGLVFFLEWSGLWRISFAQKSTEYHERREISPLLVQMGMWGLNLHLQPGQTLPFPRVLITAFDGNLADGGNALRRHIRRHVMPKLNGQEPLPPVYFNHWAAFENNFTAKRFEPLVEWCAKAGLEYFVVDAGWFEGGFRKGIGNWEHPDSEKFPDGIASFSRFVQSKGMKYGSWFEPEWAHHESRLYTQHPEWFWPTPKEMPWEPHDYPLFIFFNPSFHLMNFGLREVQEWWIERLIQAYQEWDMRWVRWDFNQMPRPNWEHGVPAGEIGWRQIGHVLGFYRVLDEIIQACPDLFIEQCASGGHRIELGTVRRGHSFWMNDLSTQTDIVRALQHGLNTILPGIYANTNLCQKRHDFTEYDYLSHSAGTLGYAGKLWEATPDEFARFAAFIQQFKEFRWLLMEDYYRPTGQPARADEYVKIIFTDGSRSLTMEFNLPGMKRKAKMTFE